MLSDVGLEKTKQLLKQDMLGCLNKFFQLCNTADYLKDPEVSWLQNLHKHVLFTKLVCNMTWVSIADQKFVRVALWQHRTNAGDRVVFGPRSDEKEWSAVFGYNLRPKFGRKCLCVLPSALVLAFKESQPQVNFVSDKV